MARNMRIIDKLEKWLEPGWLESSSLEEQRSFIYGDPERQIEETSTTSLGLNGLKEEVKIGGRNVHQLPGIFQKDGKVMPELRKGATDMTTSTKLRLNTEYHTDARFRCNGKKQVNDRKTSREEEFDKTEVPRNDKKMLNLNLILIC